MFRFGKRSIRNLQGVHPELVLIAGHALVNSPLDFAITSGVRTEEEQAILFEEGKTTTMQSRHLTGDAIDIAVFVDGQVVWAHKPYEDVAAVFKESAKLLGFGLEWGGEWVSFVDMPHFQRPR